jgi:RHS repeat-associated protein
MDGETGYQYHGARYYNEELARYMSVDPWADKYMGWSTYNYVMGNPIRLIDPNGKGATDWVKNGHSVFYDSNVHSQEDATYIYGEGAQHLDYGHTYNAKGGYIVSLLKGGHYTQNGVTHQTIDYGGATSETWEPLNPEPELYVQEGYFMQELRYQRRHEKLVADSKARENIIIALFSAPVAAIGIGEVIVLTPIVAPVIGSKVTTGAYATYKGGKWLAKGYWNTYGKEGIESAAGELTSQVVTQYTENGTFNFDQLEWVGLGTAFVTGKNADEVQKNIQGSIGTLINYTSNDGFRTFQNHSIQYNGLSMIIGTTTSNGVPYASDAVGGFLQGLLNTTEK